jgi:hypothetical protein
MRKIRLLLVVAALIAAPLTFASAAQSQAPDFVGDCLAELVNGGAAVGACFSVEGPAFGGEAGIPEGAGIPGPVSDCLRFEGRAIGDCFSGLGGGD